jgi:hypothetical protein
MTGTGTSLLLDGHDAALVRATVVDAAGIPSTAAMPAPVVTFSVSSGPGRVAGVHNGDAKSHERQASNTRSSYHGLVRAVVRVTVDSSSPGRETLLQVDAEEGDGVNTVATRASHAATAIVITASAPGLESGSVDIPVSSDAAKHSPLSAARASAAGQPLDFD